MRSKAATVGALGAACALERQLIFVAEDRGGIGHEVGALGTHDGGWYGLLALQGGVEGGRGALSLAKLHWT